MVLWELAATHEDRQRRALQLIAYAFIGLAAYLVIQTTVVLSSGLRPHHSPTGLVWTAVTAVAMFAMALGKHRIGTALGNPVLLTEGKVTLIDGMLATAILTGVALNIAFNWWWADPAASLVIVFYAAK